MDIRRAPRLASLILVGTLGCADGPIAVGDNSPPAVAMLQPLPALFSGGDWIDVLATATDPQQGVLGAASLDWWVVLHHGEHTHPFIPVTNGVPGRFGIPRAGHTDADIFYRVSVRATDAGGLSDTAHVDLAPRLVEITLLTEPAGLSVLLDHQPRQTPLTVPTLAGGERAIGAPESQSIGVMAYEFARWAHGGPVTQVVVGGEGNDTLTAIFQEAGVANVPPSVALTAPAMDSMVTAGDEITIVADAADSDGAVTAVEFFVNLVRVAADSTAPFSVTWIPEGTGSRAIAARASDDDGAVTVSGSRTVTVRAPGPGDGVAPVLEIDSPVDGSRDLTGAVAVTATATDDVGVTLVEFYLDGALLAADSTAPHEASLASTTALASGAHAFRARARDAAGNWSDWATARVTFGGDVTLPQGFAREVYASGFSDVLTAVAVSEDGRLFVAEKGGRLRVVRDGALLPQPFLEVSVLNESERGLLGVTLHPNFAVNGLVYVYYTTADGGAHNRISRFVASGDAAGPEQVLVDLPPLTSVGKHNGGAMHFGIDGKLYVAVGDNGDGSRAPSLTSPFGKILRFNADGSIPLDNPFLGQTTGVNQAIWARGLRNPFTFAIESGTGRMHINDVGQSQWEEINLGRAGADYGWPATEGPTANPAYDAPLLAYAHDQSPTLFEGNAVVGAAFYHPGTMMFGESFAGDYFFADYVRGWIYRLDQESGQATAFAWVQGFPTDLAVGTDGSLFVLVETRVERISR